MLICEWEGFFCALVSVTLCWFKCPWCSRIVWQRGYQKGAGPARRREFLLSLTLYWAWIPASDRNEKLLAWFSVHHTDGSLTRNSIIAMALFHPLPGWPASIYLIFCTHVPVFILTTTSGTHVFPYLPYLTLRLLSYQILPEWILLFSIFLPGPNLWRSSTNVYIIHYIYSTNIYIFS